MPSRKSSLEPMMIPDRAAEAEQIYEFHDGAVRRRFNPRSDEVWDYARMDYSGGATAEEVCRVYGLAISTFKARARAEGWRRKDLTVTDPQMLQDESDIAPPPAPPTPELVELAWRLMAEAMSQGRANEAKSWAKIWRELFGVADKVARKTDAAAFRKTLFQLGGERSPSPATDKSTPVPALDSLDSENDETALSPLDRLNRRARRRLDAAQAKAKRARLRDDRLLGKLANSFVEACG